MRRQRPCLRLKHRGSPTFSRRPSSAQDLASYPSRHYPIAAVRAACRNRVLREPLKACSILSWKSTPADLFAFELN
jgi:hypothetical protein